jgi:hypothetical protein
VSEPPPHPHITISYRRVGRNEINFSTHRQENTLYVWNKSLFTFSLFSFLERKKVGLRDHQLSLCVCQFLNQWTDFHEDWYEFYPFPFEGHSNRVISNNMTDAQTFEVETTLVRLSLEYSNHGQ